MQLNLLQDDLLLGTPDSNSAHPKKTKQSNHRNSFESIKEEAVKPLPSSLQPTFLLREPSAVELVKSKEPELELSVEMGSDRLPVKNPEAFKTISEAAHVIGVPQHVLRFWESRFSQIKPLKLAGGRRYYRPEDMDILATIKNLLYKQGYTIKGAKQAFSAKKAAFSVVATPKPVDIFHHEIRPFPEVMPHVLTDKQLHQLAGIRQELICLRETLTSRIY